MQEQRRVEDSKLFIYFYEMRQVVEDSRLEGVVMGLRKKKKKKKGNKEAAILYVLCMWELRKHIISLAKIEKKTYYKSEMFFYFIKKKRCVNYILCIVLFLISYFIFLLFLIFVDYKIIIYF